MYKRQCINNRDLKTFKTELKTSIKIMSKYSEIFSKHNIIPISESGINNSEDLKALDLIGIKGVLIGERLMREQDIENSFKKLFNSI